MCLENWIIAALGFGFMILGVMVAILDTRKTEWKGYAKRMERERAEFERECQRLADMLAGD